MSLIVLPTTIRLARMQDLPACVHCLADTGLPELILIEKISQMIVRHRLWTVQLEGFGICGTLGFDETVFRRSMYVEMLGIRAEHRKQGLASMLIDHAIADARSRGMKRLIAAVPRHNKAMAAAAASWGPKTTNGRMRRLRRKREAFDFWMGRI